jgi:hypothetical protein
VNTGHISRNTRRSPPRSKPEKDIIEFTLVSEKIVIRDQIIFVDLTEGRDLSLRVVRLEPTVSAWKADRLPLTDTRIVIFKYPHCNIPLRTEVSIFYKKMDFFRKKFLKNS